MEKKEMVDILHDIAVLMELNGDNTFKARAYANASRSLQSVDESVEQLLDENRLEDLPGIGKAIAQKIQEMYRTGTLPLYEELKEQVPPGLLEILKIPGLGPKKVRQLYEQLQITSIGELQYACEENRLVDLPRFGPKIQENILAGIEEVREYRGYYYYPKAKQVGETIISQLIKSEMVDRAVLSGAIRRFANIVESIDILVSGPLKKELIAYCSKMTCLQNISQHKQGIVEGFSLEGIPVRLIITSEQVWGTMLVQTTGHADHIKLLLQENSSKELPETCEEIQVYEQLSLPYIIPELREGYEEVQWAKSNTLPDPVQQQDLKGIFHVHSTYSDGTESLEDLSKQAQSLGYEYLGISDHSQSAVYARGLTEKAIHQQAQAIDTLNSRGHGAYLLKGIEVDILPDGSLDYQDSILQEMDFVIASVHSRFKMSQQEMTQRIIKAMVNPHVTILGHPTGRLLLARKPYPIDLKEVIHAARDYGVVLEINANPHRLDLDWEWSFYAHQQGVMLCISPDIHRLSGFDDVELGVSVARKAAIPPKGLLNCMDLNALRAYWEAH